MIQFKCPDGHSLKVKDQHAGKNVRCPRCKAVCRVPSVETDEDTYDDLIAADEEANQERAAARQRQRELREQQEAQQPRKRRRSATDALKVSPKVITVAAGIASALITIVVCWFVLRDSNPQSANRTAKNVPVVPVPPLKPAQAPDSSKPIDERRPPIESSTDPRETEALAKKEEPSEPLPFALTVLTPIRGNATELAFSLPAKFVAMAYDDSTGNLLGCSPEAGEFIAYNLDQLCEKKTNPVARIRTNQEPVAVALTNWSKQPAFALVSNSKNSSGPRLWPELELVDATSLESIERYRLKPVLLRTVTHLMTSGQSNDPFVYLVGTGKQNDHYIGRLDLRTKQIDSELEPGSTLFDTVSMAPNETAILSSQTHQAEWPEVSDGQAADLKPALIPPKVDVLWPDRKQGPVLARAAFPTAPFNIELKKIRRSIRQASFYLYHNHQAEPLQVTAPSDWLRTPPKQIIPTERQYGVLAISDKNLLFQSFQEQMKRFENRTPPNLTADPPAVAFLGQPLEVPIQVTPGCEIKISVSPLDRPDERPRIEQGIFKWTPRSSDMKINGGLINSTKQIEITTTDGTEKQIQRWRIKVEHPHLDLNFSVRGGTLRADGKVAALWGTDSSSQTVIATWDVVNQKTIQRKQIATTPRALAMDTNHLYLLGSPPDKKSSATLTRMDAVTLELQRTVETDLQDVKVTLFTAAPGHVVLTRKANRHSRPYHTAWTSTDLRKVTKEETPGVVPIRTSYGWWQGGVHWDPTFEKPQLLAAQGSQSLSSLAPDRYKVDLTMNRSETRLSATVVTDYSFRSTRLRRRPLFDRASPHATDPLPHQATARADVILAIAEGSAFVIRNKLPDPPLRIVPAQSEWVLETQKKTALRYTASKTVPTTWTISINVDGYRGSPLFKQESPDGQFEVEIESKSLKQRLVQDRRWRGDGSPADNERNMKQFELVQGKKPKGVPVPVTARVTARSETEEVTLTHTFYVDLPADEFEQNRQSQPQ